MSIITRAAFVALSANDQMNHIRSGGRVENDPSKPVDDMPFILDGKQRLAWIEAKGKAAE